MKAFYWLMVMMPWGFILMHGIVKFVVIVYVRMYTTKFLVLANLIKERWEIIEEKRSDSSREKYKLEEEEIYWRMLAILETAYTYYIEIRRFDESAIGFYSPAVEDELEKLFAIEEKIQSRLKKERMNPKL